MYNYSYEEYMNSILGYNANMRNNMNVALNMIEPYENENVFTYSTENSNLEECYPDIYRIIYPMVCKACLYVTEEITPELVERITNEIYENVEQDEKPDEPRSAGVKINYSNIQNNRHLKQMPRNLQTTNKEDEKRQRNFLLNDLIRILVIRELIGRGRNMQRQFLSKRLSNPIMF